MRAARARIAALQGKAAQVGEELDWLETSARSLGQSQGIVLGLGSSAIARSASGQRDAAAGLLAELEAYPGVRDSPFYPAFLPAMVRTALAIGDLDLAERLLIGLESRYRYAGHALVAARAAITEATGDLAAAAEAFGDASDRWERFGVVPELAFALLGQGRCLLALSSSTQAAPVLQRAREIFEHLEAAPAVAETDTLLQQTTALSS
jgi:tetratricopeptide (TPR) repeat protein